MTACVSFPTAQKGVRPLSLHRGLVAVGHAHHWQTDDVALAEGHEEAEVGVEVLAHQLEADHGAIEVLAAAATAAVTVVVAAAIGGAPGHGQAHRFADQSVLGAGLVDEPHRVGQQSLAVVAERFDTAEGAVQLLAGFSITYSLGPDEARHQYRALEDQCRGDDVLLLPGLNSYGGLTGVHMDTFAEAAEDAGAQGMMLYEADSLVRFNTTPSVRAINLGRSRYRRVLKARRVADLVRPDDIPWELAPMFDDFLFHFGKTQNGLPSEKTSVRLAYNSEALFVEFACEDRDMASALAPPEPDPQHQYYLDVLRHRSPYFERNTFNVLVDPSYSGRDFYQFGLTPNGEQVSGMFIDENWQAPWSGWVKADDHTWSGAFVIPFSSLQCAAPGPGDVWGANLIRGVRRTDEIDMWVPLAGQQTCPYELGRLEFLE